MNTLSFHIIELRKCVLRFGVVLCSVFCILFYYDEILYTFIAQPLLTHLPFDGKLIAIDITTPFIIPMKLAFFCAFFISAPYGLFEVWKFIKPGLYPNERKLILPFLTASILLFYGGVGFGFFILCPLCIQFFVKLLPLHVSLMPDIENYLKFVLTLLFAGGIAFQVPVVILFLIRMNIVSPLFLTHLRPYVIVGAFTLGMFLTPPDVISQILVALPMWGFYELALFIGKTQLICGFPPARE